MSVTVVVLVISPLTVVRGLSNVVGNKLDLSSVVLLGKTEAAVLTN